jgi:hypothetical protein
MPIVDGKILVGDGTGEHEALVQQPVFGHQRTDGGEVARHRIVLADEDEPVVRIDVALVVLGQAYVIFDFLVRGDSSDEQKIHEIVVEDSVERRSLHGPRDPGQIDGERQDSRRFEAERFQFAPVVVGDPQRKIDATHQCRQFLPRDRRQAEERGIVGRKVRRRCHIVVLQQASARKPGKRFGHGRRQGEMKHRQVALC